MRKVFNTHPVRRCLIVDNSHHFRPFPSVRALPFCLPHLRGFIKQSIQHCMPEIFYTSYKLLPRLNSHYYRYNEKKVLSVILPDAETVGVSEDEPGAAENPATEE